MNGFWSPRTATALVLLCSLLIGLPALAGPSAQVATFTVDTAEDAIDSDSTDGLCLTASDQCSLRAAVMQANVSPGEDVIEIPERFIANLDLIGAGEDDSVTGDLDILEDLSIQGVSLMVSGIEAGALQDRVLHVHPGVHLTLADISIGWTDAGNQDGGGVLNEGSLSLMNSSIQFGNAGRAGGVMNLGELSLARSIVGYNTASDGGGGIYNEGTVTIDRSTIDNNEVANGPGGGIENHGTLVIRNSTVSQNRAASLAGAIYNGDHALARLNNTAVNVNQITTTGSWGSSTGGIYNEPSGSVEIGNSIVAQNVARDAYRNLLEASCMGTIESAGYNLIGTDEGCSLTGDLTGNLIGLDPRLPDLPILDPDNTWGYPPLPDSPAIDAGNPAPPGSGGGACEPQDQRGLARPQGAACDIGAYEFEAPTPTPTPTGTSTLTPTPTQTPTPTATSTPAPPASPAEGIKAMQGAIRDYVTQGEIDPRAEISMMSKLGAALKSLQKGKGAAAVHQLEAFINYVGAQRGKKVSQPAADDLTARAQAVIDQIEASAPSLPRNMFNLISTCRLAVDTGQMSVRNLSGAPQAFQLWRADGAFIIEEIAPAGDSLWPVPSTRPTDTFHLRIAGHEFVKAMGKKPLCRP